MKIKFDGDGYVEGYAVVGDMPSAEEYDGGEIPDGFGAETCRYYRLVDGKLALDESRQAAELNAAAGREELAAIYEWFSWYDNQIMQYERARRRGEPFDRDISELDAEAAGKQQRIRELTGGGE